MKYLILITFVSSLFNYHPQVERNSTSVTVQTTLSIPGDINTQPDTANKNVPTAIADTAQHKDVSTKKQKERK